MTYEQYCTLCTKLGQTQYLCSEQLFTAFGPCALVIHDNEKAGIYLLSLKDADNVIKIVK